MSPLPDPFSVQSAPPPLALDKPLLDHHEPDAEAIEALPDIPEGGELAHMRALAEQVDWPALFIEAVPPDLMKKFRTYGTGKTDLERLADLIRQVEYE